MEPVRFKLFFEEKKRFYISVENIVLILVWAIVYLLITIIQRYEVDLRSEILVLTWLAIFYTLSLGILNMFRNKKAHGVFRGEIVFYDDRIQIANNVHHLNSISNLRIFAYDIKDNHSFGELFVPSLSNGLENEFTLTLKSKEVISGNFLQTKTEQLCSNKELLCHYYKKGIIRWLHLIKLLGLNDYESIEKLKRELHPRK